MADKPAHRIAPLAPTEKEIDTREAPRSECTARRKVRVSVRPSFLPITVTVKDISTKGIGLISDGYVAPGSWLALPWMVGPPERWRTLRVKVVRLAARRDGTWLVGCQFETRLEASDVEAFLDQRRAPLLAERVA
jgi:hypothetical protein